MDSIQSRHVLKLDIESFYKSIVENKHDRQSQQVKKEANQTTTWIFSRGKLDAQTPLSSIVYSPRNHETITMHSSHKSLLQSANHLILI